MAVGLGFLGRGRTTGSLPFWVLHLAAAAVAGAAVGGALGAVGMLLSLDAVRPWAIAAFAVVALGLGLRRRPPKIGRQRQVPRRWGPGVPISRVYLLWGLMLGCGLATPVFHTAFVLLMGAQATAGVWLGLVSGTVFGATRQAMALIPVLRRFGPERTMGLLAELRPMARRVNAALAVGGGVILVLASRL
jgi:hypothetical protein